ncbi:hypothetical protein [Chamaesiphon sp. OTE_8_metabat_110]|uniref:hypothetical protein n=1 Tax=Chamaesiphon sp. OTE_8_metabat_110 TaxID=2964696 RepID=UPI00286BAB65|nr:hypothetical protein [Chamaesiphon sp. OTE_8_metabat_110]
MALELPIEEYFKYHPPTTPERIALHDRANLESLTICKSFVESQDYNEWLVFRDAAILLAQDVCQDKTCLDWAKSAVVKALSAYSIANTDSRSTAILMHIQQFRMFLNQGITVDELKRSSDSSVNEELPPVAGMPVGTLEAMSTPMQNQEMKLKIVDGEITDLKPLYSGVHLTLDGDKWCAQTSENLQVGISGFGDDPIAALSDLYVNLRGIEFQELKNSSGHIYSTSIKSLAEPLGMSDNYRAFIEAYGSAIANLDANGLSDRETLIAELIAAAEDEI